MRIPSATVKAVVNLDSVAWHGGLSCSMASRSELVYFAVEDGTLACHPVLACATADA